MFKGNNGYECQHHIIDTIVNILASTFLLIKYLPQSGWTVLINIYHISLIDTDLLMSNVYIIKYNCTNGKNSGIIKSSFILNEMIYGN